MSKYAIAICTGTDNKVVIVEVDNPVNAIKLGIEENLEFDLYNTVEEALQYYFDGDIIISEPVEI